MKTNNNMVQQTTISMTFTEYLCSTHNLDHKTELANYRNYIPKSDLKQIMVNALFERFRTPEHKLIGKTREREIVMQRHAIMYFLYKSKRYTLKEIGLMFGGKNHATVINAVKKVDDFLSYKDPQFMPYYEAVKESYENIKI
jgi:chromosomal replication initiation ATPase DnaA